VNASSNAILALAIAVSLTALASAIASFKSFEFAIFLTFVFDCEIIYQSQSEKVGRSFTSHIGGYS
jgi:hypothetical protein